MSLLFRKINPSIRERSGIRELELAKVTIKKEEVDLIVSLLFNTRHSALGKVCYDTPSISPSFTPSFIPVHLPLILLF